MITSKVIFPDGKEAEFTFRALPVAGQQINLNKFIQVDVEGSEWPEWKPIAIKYRIAHVAWELFEDPGTIGHSSLRVILEPFVAPYTEVSI